MLERAGISAVLALLGLVLLLAAAALRGGTPSALRFWMDPWYENWQAERVVLLGIPLAGAALLCAAAIAAPVESSVPRLLGIGGLVVLCVPGLYFLLAFLPLPGFLYPRWARLIRAGRAQRLQMLRGRGLHR
ncbi:hypothetical protein [Brachybacterium hainanense]|uniref:Uncharacterized protein n=1 Tax=Brachybacterium hainanense TaxID=1541174 RepID=A0ABV6R5Z7_9MICO